MSAVKYFVLFMVAIAASSKIANALSEEEVSKFREAVMPSVQECGEKFGTTKEDFLEAKKNKNIDGIDSCFIACVFKKAGIIDDKGLFDSATAFEKGKKYISRDEDVAVIDSIGKDCAAVNVASVSDGEAGCDRSKLLLACFLKHKDMIQL